MDWIVVRTLPSKERWAAENIANQGYTYYLPQVLEVKRKRGKQQIAVARPLFPRYIFVQTAGQWKFLLGTFGVAGVILNGEAPAVIRDTVIEELREREVDGCVTLPSDPLTSKFKPGERVRIQSGVFAGQTGIYAGMGTSDREKVLLDYLGRRTPVLIAEGLLEKGD